MCPRVAGGAAPRDSRQWPLRVTVTGEQTTQSSAPSLPGSVTHPASLTVPSSLHTLPDPCLPGAPGTRRRSSGILPPGSPRRKATDVTCPGHASNFGKVLRQLGQKETRPRHARPATPPPAPRSGHPGATVAGRGRGTRFPPPRSRGFARSPSRPGGATPGSLGWSDSVSRARLPRPRVLPARVPALTCAEHARRGRRGQLVRVPGAQRAATRSALGRAAVGAAGPGLRVRRRRERLAEPAPPAAPPPSSVENSGAHGADARRASSQAARSRRPAPEAPPPPPPRASPRTLTRPGPGAADPGSAPRVSELRAEPGPRDARLPAPCSPDLQMGKLRLRAVGAPPLPAPALGS